MNLRLASHQVIHSQLLTELFLFLPSTEVTKLQAVCIYLYKTGVGRAQLKVPLPRFVFFLRPDAKMVDEMRLPAYTCSEKTIPSANYGRISVQVGADLFYMIDRTKCCGILHSSSWRNFKTQALPNLHESRQGPALALHRNSHIYATGGKGRNCAERFDIEKNSWERVAKMNCVRYMHASCALDDQIYIFSGMRDLSEEEQYL